uniref:Uncharacterized protein n=1 Tax=Arundo donax TaxID=35708 RepID=A0A0A9FDE7_ARUDO
MESMVVIRIPFFACQCPRILLCSSLLPEVPWKGCHSLLEFYSSNGRSSWILQSAPSLDSFQVASDPLHAFGWL